MYTGYMKYIVLIVVVLLIAWISWSFYAYTVETLQYTVLEQNEGYEIRQYAPYIAMQVEVEGETQEALNMGFRILAGYIFGDNKGQKSVAMTAPVMETVSVGVGEKISTTVAMTAPVMEQVSGSNGKKIITFTAPSEYTLDTLPVPNTDRIQFVQVPAKKYAAHTFTWYYTTARIAAKKAYLVDLLKRDGRAPLGEPMFAGYNGPGTVPFLMRNEILVEIE
jgi:hypothetical protein